jgi:hypothetical protein
MRVLACLGFLLVATAAQAETWTTTTNRETQTVTTNGSGYTTTTRQVSRSSSTTTTYSTVSRPHGYQPAATIRFRIRLNSPASPP